MNEEGSERSGHDELAGRMDSRGGAGGFVLIDTRDRRAFEGEPLPGAVNVPLGEGFEEGVREAAPRVDQEIVVYCTERGECHAPSEAARRVAAMGYQRVQDYEKGRALEGGEARMDPTPRGGGGGGEQQDRA